MERPYTIGDWIRYNDCVGRVVGIGWKSTRLITFENELIYVPNMDIAKTVLTNYSKPTKRIWMVIELGVEYGAAPNKMRDVIAAVLDQESMVIKEPRPTIRVLDYGDFAIKYKIRFMYEDYGNMPALRGAIMNNIWYALRRNNIRIPFPIRDVHHRHIERRFEQDQLKMERESAMAEIESVPIFTPLPHEARGMLAQRMEIVRFGDGEEVVRQGDAGESMYILHSGAGEVLIKKPAAEPIKVADLNPSSFFGEMSLLTGEPRTATVRVKGDSTLFKIDKELFGDILGKDVSVSEKLAEALAARQAETAEKLGQVERDRAAHVSNLTKRIKSFFGIG
jgi:CRP-like cAMP-binding protein